ncbi:MAG: rod shape-determining protein MreD [Planctomycetota bacterium]|nr:MAG: rod shape-determining protein MreD [Planctomycetota bacterium]
MKHAVVVMPFVLFAVFAELALSAVFGGQGAARPDLVLIVVCMAALNLPERPAVLCGFASGFVLDAFSGGAFGTCIAAYTAAAFIANRLRRGVAHENILTQIILVFAITGFVESACIARLGVLSRSFDIRLAVDAAIGTAVLTALAAPVVFQLRQPVFERIGALPHSRGLSVN